MKRAIAAIFAALLGVLFLPATPASSVSSFTLFATHPSVASQSTWPGRTIGDMAYKDGKLFLGYGDYDANTGPIDVATVDVSTGATGVALEDTPTEQLSYREFDGNLYAPWVDPRIGWDQNVGFSTDLGGWHNVYAAPAIHVYDVAVYKGYTYFSGSVEGVGAGIYRAPSLAGPWELVMKDVSRGGPNGWERYYWLAIAGDKLIAQAVHKNYDGTNDGWQAFPLRAFDGIRWSKVNLRVSGPAFGHLSLSQDIESFKGVAYATTGYTFDGKTRRDMTLPDGSRFTPNDLYKTADWLYAVTYAGEIYRTAGGASPAWEHLGSSGINRSSSIAVVGNDIFIGHLYNGDVYRGTL